MDRAEPDFGTHSVDRIFPGFILAVGLLFVAVGLWAAFDTWSFRSESIGGTGEVIDLRTQRPPGEDDRFAPIIEFEATDGQTYVFESRVSQRPAVHAVGDSVEIRYREGAPDDARVDSLVANWLLPIALGVVGIVFFTFGVMLRRYFRKRRVTTVPQDVVRAELRDLSLIHI